MPRGYVGTVADHRATPPNDLIEILRCEAPAEFDRLRSIVRVVASGRAQAPLPPGSGGGAHEAWLRDSFGIFGPAGEVGSAAVTASGHDLGPLAASSERHRQAAPSRVERPEHPVLHHAPSTASGGWAPRSLTY